MLTDFYCMHFIHNASFEAFLSVTSVARVYYAHRSCNSSCDVLNETQAGNYLEKMLDGRL